MAEIIVETNGNVKTIKSPEGYKITDWNPETDIRKFSSFSIAYVHKDKDLSIYRLIDDAENMLLTEQQDKVLQEDFMKEVEKRKLEENGNLYQK